MQLPTRRIDGDLFPGVIRILVQIPTLGLDENGFRSFRWPLDHKSEEMPTFGHISIGEEGLIAIDVFKKTRDSFTHAYFKRYYGRTCVVLMETAFPRHTFGECLRDIRRENGSLDSIIFIFSNDRIGTRRRPPVNHLSTIHGPAKMKEWKDAYQYDRHI